MGCFRLERYDSSGLRSFHSDLITAFVNEGMVHHDTIIMKNLSPFAYVQCTKVASKRYTSKYTNILWFSAKR